MGMGDEIMITAQVKAMQRCDPRKVEVLDRHGNRRWHELWEGSPRIAKQGERGDFQRLVNGSGCRPYIDHQRSTAKRWAFRQHHCEPGELYGIEPDGRGNGGIVIDPTIKRGASVNKQWHRWQELVQAAPGVRWLHVGPPQTRWLKGAIPTPTASFRAACAVLRAARGAVLHEGGLHHAAAALGTPAVVIYGGFTSPAQTGYDLHRNLFTGGEPCGMRVRCEHCAAAMRQITPAWVLASLEELLHER